jgi:hypothetical protein
MKTARLTYEGVPPSEEKWEQIWRAIEAREQALDGEPYPWGPGQLWDFLLYLSKQYGQPGEPFELRIDYLREKYGVTERQIFRMLNYLEDAGMLRVEHDYTGTKPHVGVRPLSGVSREMLREGDEHIEEMEDAWDQRQSRLDEFWTVMFPLGINPANPEHVRRFRDWMAGKRIPKQIQEEDKEQT